MENKNVKIYSILSYIGFLWIVGILVKEKDDPTVKFHVGQGMLLSICGVAFSTVIKIISSIFLNIFKLFFGGEVLYGFGIILLIVVSIVFAIIMLVFMIIGIVNAANGKNEELPIIGKYSFYK